MDRERIIEALLAMLLSEAGDDVWGDAAGAAAIPPFDDDGDPVKRVTSFEDAGVLTTNRGVVLELTDGSEYQITIVASRNPR